jgi:predicted GIY-YIG superfamily endonuclease/proteasome lid subunit RPN8/RPN11
MLFHAYMLHCADGSYYTGHTDNLQMRMAQHNQGQIKGYTRHRRPVRLVWTQEFGERHEAIAAERQIKGWSRAKKEALIDGRWDEVSRLARGREQFVLRQAQDERIIVGESVVAQILSAAHNAHPREACGILLGRAGRITVVRETRNVHRAPETRFEIDPQALIDAYRDEREGGLKVLGFFHSHPVGRPIPSATDKAFAAGDGKVWAIIAGDDLMFWQDNSNGFDPLSYEVVAR